MTRRPRAHRLAAVLLAIGLASVLTACGDSSEPTELVAASGPDLSTSVAEEPVATSEAPTEDTSVPPATTTTTAKPAPTTTSKAAPKPAPKPAPAPKPTGALNFTAKTVAGADFNAATLAGKPVLFWFWAPWCPLCVDQGAEVAAVAKQFAGKATVVGVGGMAQGMTQMTKDFVTKTKVTGFTNLTDDAGVVWKKFGITEQGRYALVDGAGKVVFTGYLSKQGMIDRLNKLLGAQT
ncbi:MAG TPA: redoxin domain-containing protein [Actinokineospora sp.]|jgi:thiol-disulfide isomerase/thioredoxin|nr:redoxin domain-containing protein [Actinokineospora sp.]